MTYKTPLAEHTDWTIEHPNVTYGQFLDVAGFAIDYRLQWIDLPPGAFNGSIGAVMLLPHHRKNATQDIVICNLSAGGGTAALLLDTNNGGPGVVSRKMTGDLGDNGRPLAISQTNTPSAELYGDDWLDYQYPDYPQHLVNITESWAKYLNPLIPSQNMSLINLLTQQETFPGYPFNSASRVLAGLVVNGLSRVSFESKLQGDVKTVGPRNIDGLDGNYWLSGKGDIFNVDPNRSRNWATLRVC